MHIKDLKTSKDDYNVYQCPNCQEYELRNLFVKTLGDEDITYTDDYICDNIDCGVEYHQDINNDLIRV